MVHDLIGFVSEGLPSPVARQQRTICRRPTPKGRVRSEQGFRMDSASVEHSLDSSVRGAVDETTGRTAEPGILLSRKRGQCVNAVLPTDARRVRARVVPGGTSHSHPAPDDAPRSVTSLGSRCHYAAVRDGSRRRPVGSPALAHPVAERIGLGRGFGDLPSRKAPCFPCPAAR